MESVSRVLRVSLAGLLPVLLVYSCNTVPGKEAKNNQAGAETSHSAKDKAGTDTVFIQDMKFQPVEIKVHRGDTIIWVNKDMVDHCVTEYKSKAWTSGAIPSGSEWKMAAKQSLDYYCAIHPVMKGKITVE